MDSILQSIEVWFRELLVSGIMNNIGNTFDSVNNQVGQIATEVGTTPAAFSPAIFNRIRSQGSTSCTLKRKEAVMAASYISVPRDLTKVKSMDFVIMKNLNEGQVRHPKDSDRSQPDRRNWKQARFRWIGGSAIQQARSICGYRCTACERTNQHIWPFRTDGLIDKPRKSAYNNKLGYCEHSRSDYMEYMTIKEATVKWGLSERRVQEICEQEKVPGVTKFGRAWAIPVDAEKPVDLRIKSGKYLKCER